MVSWCWNPGLCGLVTMCRGLCLVGTGFGRCSLHALLEHGVATGLADDEVGPLHNYDAGKEGRVACELYHLPLLVGLGGREGGMVPANSTL